MHHNRTWQLNTNELRTQRNRILPIQGGDGSAFGFDFINTNESLLGNQFTFSRTSNDGFGNATFISAQGYVQYATSNQVAISESLVTSAAWSGSATAEASDVPDPTGGTGGSKITNTAGSSSRGCAPAVTAGIPHVCRFWIRAGTSTKANFGYYKTSFQTGTVSIVGGDTTPTVSGTGFFLVTGLTNNWTQIEFKLTAPSNSGSLYFYPDTSTGTVGLYNYVWGVQMNIGTVSSPYVKTTGTAYQGPRFEYSSTRQPLGLLLESTGKNWIKYSEDQSNAAWVAYQNSGTSVKGDKSTTTAPDGSANGNKLTITGTGNNGIYQQLNASLLDVTKTLTVSFWAWTESGTGTIRINYFSGSSSIGPDEAITTTPRRISRTFKVASTNSSSNVTVSNAGGAVTLVWWGYQVEEGYVPSSYIPTVATELSRNADVMKMSGTAFSNWFKQDEGTILMSFDYQNQNDPQAAIYPRLATFAPSANVYTNPVISIGYGVSSSKYFVNAKQSNGSTIADLYTAKSYFQNASMALGASYSNNTGKTIICANGDAPSTATNSFTYDSTGIGQVDFTSLITSGIMHLKFFKFWGEAKPAAELQQIVNNANSGYTPAIVTQYLTGDIGNCLRYNYLLDGTTFSSLQGGSFDSWITAGVAECVTGFSFGMRIVVTKGSLGDVAGYVCYSINDEGVNSFDTEVPSPVALVVGDQVAFGLFGGIPTGIAGRIEVYNSSNNRTVTSFEFRT
jgi:hypothetical protein